MPSNLRSHAVILPAIWSSYLVNGDATGLSEEDRRQADDFLTLERLPSPASVEPDGFGQADATLALGGNAALFQDLSRYTFLVPATVPDVAPNADAEEEEEEEEADPTFACYSCDEIAPEEDATDIGGRLYCPGCWRTCYRCEESIPLDESYTVHNRARGRWTAVEVCESCRGNAYPSCDGCGDHHHEDHTIYRESRDASFCVDCDPGEVNDDNDDDSGNGLSHGPFAIRSYHSVAEDMGPIVSPWTEANGQRYLGVELEVECSYTAGPGREESARRILQSVHAAAEAVTEGRAAGRRLLGAENDGSLTHGFELVSAPLGLDDHARLWRTVLTREHCVGMKSHQTTTCGLHVHLSRTGLTSLQIAKMVVFINAEGNRPLILAVARRYDTGYCKLKSKALDSAHLASGDRYEMLNLENARTVEFRIFRGSLRLIAVLAAIEYANALANFCALPGDDLTATAFVAYLHSPAGRKDTKNLRAYLVERGYLPATPSTTDKSKES